MCQERQGHPGSEHRERRAAPVQQCSQECRREQRQAFHSQADGHAGKECRKDVPLAQKGEERREVADAEKRRLHPADRRNGQRPLCDEEGADPEGQPGQEHLAQDHVEQGPAGNERDVVQRGNGVGERV